MDLVRPGLAYMEGNMRGPSSLDCEKSFARTGIPSANLLSKKPSIAGLVQIQDLRTARPALSVRPTDRPQVAA